MGTDENQEVWDGRVRHFETRLNEVVTCTERTERRVGEQISETRQQIRESRTATAAQISELRAETRQQIAELRTEVKGQLGEMLVVLRALATQRT